MLIHLVVASFALRFCIAAFPNTKIYGVNIGNWLIFEPWMAENEWASMGGQNCGDCTQCISTESALVRSNPNGADALFNNHWTTWFTQNEVNQLKNAGINTARVPIGWWIVESLVNRSSEFFPKGGILQLKRGVQMLKNAGIEVILDLHAGPGAQVPGNAFTGVCSTSPQFYTSANYARALRWTVVMTVLAHLDPDFGSAFAIEAINEPNMDANTTPGYGTYQTNFVQTVRAVELALGMTVPNHAALSGISTTGNNLNTTLITAAQDSAFSSTTQQALRSGLQDLQSLASTYGLGSLFTYDKQSTNLLYTNFMDINWQFNSPPNPSAAAIGNQAYDNHLYYSFGGVADANEDAYLSSICNLQRVQNDASVGNSPLWFGEWSLATQFDPDNTFYPSWADSQKMAYSQGAGWIFWNFKMENSSYSAQWSYLEALSKGYLTQDPSAYNNPNVCDGF